MTYYLLNYPRPIGIEPTIYRTKPKIDKTPIEIEPGYFMEDPFLPDIIEVRSMREALIRIIRFNDTDDYLKELKVEKINYKKRKRK